MWEILWVLSTSWPPPSLQLGDSLSPSTQSLLIHIECCQASFALLRCIFFGQTMIIKMNHWRHGRAGIYQMKHLMRLVNEVAISMEEKVMMVKLISFFQCNESFALDQVHSNDPWDPAWVQLVQEVRGRPAGGLWGVQVNLTDVIVIIILLWSIESDMAVVPTPLLELIQRARSWTSSSTRATKALISHRWEVPTCVPTVPTGGNEENYFCEHYCRDSNEFRWCEEMRIFVIHCNRMASQYSDSKNSSSGDWFCEALKITIKNHIDKVIKMLEKAKLHFVDFGLWSSRLSLNPETHLRCFSF